MSSIKDALRVIALEKHVDELRTQVDALIQRQNELEAAWREAAQPRAAAGASPAMTDARKAQGRF